MYTHLFKDAQKPYFLDLLIYAAHSNKQLDAVQKLVINACCTEMGMPLCDYQAAHTLEEVLQSLRAGTSPQERRMMFTELMGVLIVDGEIDEDEEGFVMQVEEAFGLTEAEAEGLLTESIAIMDAYNRLTSMIYKA